MDRNQGTRIGQESKAENSGPLRHVGGDGLCPVLHFAGRRI